MNAQEIFIIVPGEPVGKGRPKFVRATGRAYTPEKTVNFETQIKLEYARQAGKDAFEPGTELGIRIDCFFAIPVSVSRKKHAQMAADFIRPTKRPDLDNVLKVVGDALQNVAYHDDCQIVYAEVNKLYADWPRTEITLWDYRQRPGETAPVGTEEADPSRGIRQCALW